MNQILSELLPVIKKLGNFMHDRISASWSRRWQEIIPFLQYPEFIKRAIYTTNIIEASNRQIRKVIKTKGSFLSDDAVYKIVYLALQNAKKNGQCR